MPISSGVGQGVDGLSLQYQLAPAILPRPALLVLLVSEALGDSLVRRRAAARSPLLGQARQHRLAEGLYRLPGVEPHDRAGELA